ncbi:MAG: hypothetical protein HC781_16220 [Leptolyngbyaceae cyanobacterium CSU_1_4]|nr:hypothetical protein [Leptolyngbyaceae cyanobacterium CSU_1_4]
MAIFRQYIAPLIVVLVFLVALLAVSARIFLPNDMAAPAPVEEVGFVINALSDEVAGIPSSLETLVKGLPLDPAAQL